MNNICMVGTGYVGLVTGAGLTSLGHNVTCVDIDAEKIQNLQSGRVPFYEEGLPRLVEDGIYSGRLHFSTSLKEGLTNANYVIIAVATPQSLVGKPDLSQLFSVFNELATQIDRPVTIIVKSTVPVGCFKDLKKCLLDGNMHEENFRLVSCPEFLAEGSAVNDFFHPTRTIIGADNEEIARDIGALFKGVSGPRVYTNVETAQMIKYASNSFLAARVAFINEIARLAEHFGVDVHHVEDGMLLDSRFGNGYLRAGIGFGGPCLPKDLMALIHTAHLVGYEATVFNAIAVQNAEQLQHTIEVLCHLAGEGGNIAVFGVSFKAGTSDIRNSLSIKIIQELVKRKHLVVASDPEALKYDHSLLNIPGVTVKENPWQAAKGSDVQAFLTNWPDYKRLDLTCLYNSVRRPCIFDGPGLFEPAKITAAGFTYTGIGRVLANQLMIIEN